MRVEPTEEELVECYHFAIRLLPWIRPEAVPVIAKIHAMTWNEGAHFRQLKQRFPILKVTIATRQGLAKADDALDAVMVLASRFFWQMNQKRFLREWLESKRLGEDVPILLFAGHDCCIAAQLRNLDVLPAREALSFPLDDCALPVCACRFHYDEQGRYARWQKGAG